MLDVTYNSQKIIDSLEVTPPVTVTYNGSTIATLNDGDTKTLQCNGKVMSGNVVIGGKTLQCNGKLMASDVVVEVGGVTPTGETWLINETPAPTSNPLIAVVNFVSNEMSFDEFVWYTDGSLPAGTRIASILYSNTEVYDYNMTSGGSWTNQAYRTITLDSPATGDFLTWLEANAVKQ